MKARLALGLGAAALVAASATAKPIFSVKEVREISGRYAACVIRLSPTRARLAVVSRDRTPPVIGECLNEASRLYGGKMRFQSEMYRYGLAEALLVRDYPQGLPDGIAAAPMIDRPAPEAIDPANAPHDDKRAAAQREKATQHQYLRAMDLVTDCVVRRSPAAAYALVRSPVEGAAETAAFNQLKPALAECLSAGNTVSMNRSVLRGSLAYTMYQLAYAVRPVGGRGA